MKIGINASFLRKQNTGIGQVTANFLKKLAEFPISNFQPASPAGRFPNEEIEFILYLEEDLDQELQEKLASSQIRFRRVVFLPLWKRDDLIRKIWWEKITLPRRVKKDECDVLLSLYQCPTIISGKTKHLMLVHDIIPKLFPEYLSNARKKLYQSLSERAIRNADKILTVSHRSEKDLVQHLDIEPARISVNHIDVDEIYKEIVSEEKLAQVLKKYKLKSGYIYNGGGLEMRKNTENVLRAYKTLKENFGNAIWLPKLVISGKLMPNLAPLICDAESLVKGLELEKDVILLDWVPQEDLPALYRSASVFVYPSMYEGFGLPILEAMSQGVPTITAKTSSLPEVGGDSALYCNPKDVDDIAMVIKNVLTNNHLKASLSLKGMERSKHFNWEKFVQKTINIITQL